MTERCQLVDECNSLELTAKIAFKAMNEELMSFVKKIITDIGCNDLVEVRSNNVDDRIRFDPYAIYLTFSNNKYSNIQIHFDCLTSSDLPTKHYDAYCNNGLCSTIGVTNIKQYMVLNAIVQRLPAINDMLNSPVFNSYFNDISAYLDAKQNVKKFDEEEKKKKIANIASMFKPGMLVETSSNHMLPIEKVSRLRVKIKDFKRYCSGNRSTVDKYWLANWIYNGSWRLYNDNRIKIDI